MLMIVNIKTFFTGMINISEIQIDFLSIDFHVAAKHLSYVRNDEKKNNRFLFFSFYFLTNETLVRLKNQHYH